MKFRQLCQRTSTFINNARLSKIPLTACAMTSVLAAHQAAASCRVGSDGADAEEVFSGATVVTGWIS